MKTVLEDTTLAAITEFQREEMTTDQVIPRVFQIWMGQHAHI